MISPPVLMDTPLLASVRSDPVGTRPRHGLCRGWRRKRRRCGTASGEATVLTYSLSKYGFQASRVRTRASADRAKIVLLPRVLSSVLNRPSQQVRREPASGERFPGVSAPGQSTGLPRKPQETCHSARRWVRRRVRLVWELADGVSGCFWAQAIETARADDERTSIDTRQNTRARQALDGSAAAHSRTDLFSLRSRAMLARCAACGATARAGRWCGGFDAERPGLIPAGRLVLCWPLRAAPTTSRVHPRRSQPANPTPLRRRAQAKTPTPNGMGAGAATQLARSPGGSHDILLGLDGAPSQRTGGV